jgi:transcription elongation factor SPT5
LVPIREMADVLSVESKSVDLSRDSWVRMKLGVYKGDLAKVRSLLLYPVLTYLLLILI